MAHTQNLILRIVAQRGEISTAELLEVLQKFGRSADAVRAATNRMAQAGLLTRASQGRGKLRYKVGPQGQALINQFVAKILRWHKALVGQLAWDGNWLVVTFGIPESQRVKRDTLRARLTEMGFGLLSASVWISPLDQEPQVTGLIQELDLAGQVTLLRCHHIWQPGFKGNQDLAYQVWRLETLEARYQHFNRRAQALQAALEQAQPGEEVDGEAIFFEVLDLQGELIEIILAEDPCLPPELLPPDWPGWHIDETVHALTRAMNQLEPADSRYHYLFHLLQGMEALQPFMPEGDQSLHWPTQGEARG